MITALKKKGSVLFFPYKEFSKSLYFFLYLSGFLVRSLFLYLFPVGWFLSSRICRKAPATTYSTPNLYEKSQERSMFDSFKKKYGVNKITEARSSVTVLVVTKTVNISQEGTRPICTC